MRLITTMSEKWGRGERISNQMRNFQQTLESCELFDLGYKGPKYTWSNGQLGNAIIKERLDMGVANHEWCNLFPKAEVCVEALTNSDHTLLTLCLCGQQRPRQGLRFKYESCWSLDKGYNDVLQKVWNRPTLASNTYDQVAIKLRRLQHETSRWRKGNGGQIQVSITGLQ